ncbi:MAG: hypothetical protein AB8G77_03810 [Rhodothermales bacterium]
MIFWLTSYPGASSSYGQKSAIDYRINKVEMFETDSHNGSKKPVPNLEAYLYDIGPMPSFTFEVEVEQLHGNSLNANKTDLIVERYILLKANDISVYEGLQNEHEDVNASPAWSYHGAVPLQFSRKASTGSNKVQFISKPYQISFLDPENPLTFARPANYTIIGYAFRFLLSPSSIHVKDKNPTNNAYQLTFLKP